MNANSGFRRPSYARYWWLALVYALCTTALYFPAHSQKCADFEIHDGAEPVVAYGMDTTKNWWFVTEPYSGRLRLNVNGRATPKNYLEIKPPVFSTLGTDWATFCFDNGMWFLVKNGVDSLLDCTSPGQITFSQSGTMAFTYWRQKTEFLSFGPTEHVVLSRSGPVLLACDGEDFIYAAKRPNGMVYVTKSGESPLYDEVVVGGMWVDRRPVFSARRGPTWSLYIGQEEIGGQSAAYSELRLNLLCNTLAVIRQQPQSSTVLLHSDEFVEPVEGPLFNRIWALTLHPTAQMYGFLGSINGITKVGFNRTTYDVGSESGEPYFTYDGSELVFQGRENGWFITSNGKRHMHQQDIPMMRLAIKPGSSTFAHTNNSTLLLRYYSKDLMHAGMMVDRIGPTRYNRFQDRYEAIGQINQRLYLLTCSP